MNEKFLYSVPINIQLSQHRIGIHKKMLINCHYCKDLNKIIHLLRELYRHFDVLLRQFRSTKEKDNNKETLIDNYYCIYLNRIIHILRDLYIYNSIRFPIRFDEQMGKIVQTNHIFHRKYIYFN